MDYGGHHYFMCTVYSALMTSNGCTRWATGAYFYGLWLFTATQLRIHNSENKILIRYHIVWLLVVIFSQRATREAMQDCFPRDNRRRKAWEDACGQIKLHKNPLLFLSSLALMPLSLLVDHSYWKSLQTTETRDARCYLLGCKYTDATHDARPLEFLSADFPRYQRRLDSLWGKIDSTAFGLNLYLYPSPPVSSFSSCGHHISILFSELSISRCVVVKIATGSASSSLSATILRHQNNGAPHSSKYV